MAFLHLKHLGRLKSALCRAYWGWYYEIKNEANGEAEMSRYPDPLDKTADPWHPSVGAIVVPDERSKQELMAAFRYFHDSWSTDTDYQAVNTLAHLYQAPELFLVVPECALPGWSEIAPETIKEKLAEVNPWESEGQDDSSLEGS
jgi:hypothetical protein